jgi:small GTP-binding protein
MSIDSSSSSLATRNCFTFSQEDDNAAATSVNYEYLLKLLIIGDSAVGKSSLLSQFSDARFSSAYISTIGVDFKIRTVQWNGKRVKVQMWDTAGQERFRSITASYYRSAHGVLLVFDLTCSQSFSNIKNWLQEVELYADPQVRCLLIGNKQDLAEQRQVSYKEVADFVDAEALRKSPQTYAKSSPQTHTKSPQTYEFHQFPQTIDNNSRKMRYLETSAKSATNVHEAFLSLVDEILQTRASLTDDKSRCRDGVALRGMDLDSASAGNNNNATHNHNNTGFLSNCCT